MFIHIVQCVHCKKRIELEVEPHDRLFICEACHKLRSIYYALAELQTDVYDSNLNALRLDITTVLLNWKFYEEEYGNV